MAEQTTQPNCVTFVVEGIKPYGKQSVRFTKKGFSYIPKETRDYQNIVKHSFLEQTTLQERKFLLEQDNLSVDVVAMFSPPKSYSVTKKNRLLNTPYNKKPDADNILKALLDAINGIAFTDDAVISRITINKIYKNVEGIIVVLKPNDYFVNYKSSQ